MSDECADLLAFINAIPDEKLVVFEKLFERVSNLFDDVTERESDLLLYAYIVGVTDVKAGLHDQHQGGIGD